MDNFLIVDGMNLFFQMFYGMPSRILNSEGKPIHGVLGFVGAILKIIRKCEPSHIVVIFDGETHNPRSELDGDYKANRPDYAEMSEEELPFSQLPYIYACLDHLGIIHFETVGCETDDVISSYAHRYGGECKIIISSFDSDFFQLIDDNISVLRYRGESTTLCTPEYVRSKFGIPPSLYADHKSLVGDNADNIRGLHGVGIKTAASLLSEHGSLEGVIACYEKIKKESIRVEVEKEKERLRTNYALIKLGDGADIPYALDELAYTYGGQKTNEVLKAVGVK